MCRIEAVLEEPASAESGGTYTPDSRKDLMLLMRRREDAEGESRIIGSGRLPRFLGRETSEGFVLREVTVEDACWPCLLRVRPRKDSAVLRTWEKS